MKIRMACEWKNLGRFAIDHFAICDGFPDDGTLVNPSERVEPLHRHYLNCYFKASTYAEKFTSKEFRKCLDSDGHVFPFQEIFMILEDVLKSWHEKLIFPYSEKLELVRDSKTYAANKVIWRGSPTSVASDNVKREFNRKWSAGENESYYELSQPREYVIGDFYPEWDEHRDESYRKMKRLSIASKRGSKEEMVRELMMDFLFLLAIIMKDEDLDHEYKLAFRIDDVAAKNCDFGAEMTVKGCLTDIVGSWEEYLILRYVEKFGRRKTTEILKKFDTFNTFNLFVPIYGDDDELKEMMRNLLEQEFFAHGQGTNYTIDDLCGNYREKIKRMIFLRSVRQEFARNDERLREEDTEDTVGVVEPQEPSDMEPQMMEYFRRIVEF